MSNNKLPPRIDLDTHLFLAKKISGFVYGVNFNQIKYNHVQAHQIVNIVENAIGDKYPEVSEYIVKARKYKKRIKTYVLVRILSLLDDDYCRVDDDIFFKYKFIYTNS